jgi:hypothetical protein
LDAWPGEAAGDAWRSLMAHAPTVTVDRVGVICDHCKADLERITLTAPDGKARRTIVWCEPCGTVVCDENRQREPVRAIVCPGGPQDIGEIWAPTETLYIGHARCPAPVPRYE